ncbi:MAG: hypothetical protein ACE5FY_03425 [Nitrospiria bacterium]
MNPVVARSEWVEWIADGEIGYAFNDNMTNGMFDSAKEEEQIFEPSISAGRIYQMTDFTRLALTADVKYQYHKTFSRLDNIAFGSTLGVEHKFGIGPFIPWIRTDLSAARIESRSRFRDGAKYVVGLRVGKRLHERVDLQAGYVFDTRKSDRSRVFDLEGHRGIVKASFLMTKWTLFSIGYGLRDGNTVSNCRQEIIDSGVLSGIIEGTPVLDDALPGCAYKTTSTTQDLAADLSYAFFSGHASFNLGYVYKRSTASKFTYKNNIYRSSLNYSF